MPSIREAQERLNNVSFYSSLGTNRSEVQTLPLNITEAMLGLYTIKFIEEANKNLAQTNSVSSGKLQDSLGFKNTFTGQKYIVDYLAEDYYKFVDEGVQGTGPGSINNTSPFRYKNKMPPIADIQKWLKTNKGKGRARDVNRYGMVGVESKSISDRSLAFLIARSIKRKGLKATGFWSKAWAETFKDFDEQMSKALGEDIKIELRNINRDVNNS
jgi:hypothetical protein